MANQKKTRYFIVWFSGLDDEKEVQDGKMLVECINGHFVQEDYIIQNAEKDYELKDIFVRNIIELNEDDFKDYVGSAYHRRNSSEDNQSSNDFI